MWYIQIQLKNVLVIIIAIQKYDHPQLNDLPGTQFDRDKLIHLFGDKYKYKIMTHADNRLTEEDMREFINKARLRFKYPNPDEDGCDEFDGVMVFFSGHGRRNYILCSDYNEECSQGVIDRMEFLQSFNGINCPKQVEYQNSTSWTHAVVLIIHWKYIHREWEE